MIRGLIHGIEAYQGYHQLKNAEENAQKKKWMQEQVAGVRANVSPGNHLPRNNQEQQAFKLANKEFLDKINSCMASSVNDEHGPSKIQQTQLKSSVSGLIDLLGSSKNDTKYKSDLNKLLGVIEKNPQMAAFINANASNIIRPIPDCDAEGNVSPEDRGILANPHNYLKALGDMEGVKVKEEHIAGGLHGLVKRDNQEVLVSFKDNGDLRINCDLNDPNDIQLAVECLDKIFENGEKPELVIKGNIDPKCKSILEASGYAVQTPDMAQPKPDAPNLAAGQEQQQANDGPKKPQL